MPNIRATLALYDGPHSVCGVCFSPNLNKSTSYLSLCLSLNSFCDETLRTAELQEKEMATHSSILAWRIPLTEEPGCYSPWGPKKSDAS